MPTPSLVTTLSIGGHPVRFYCSPRDVPDFPWIAYVDMLAAAEVPQEGWQLWCDRARETFPEFAYDLPDGTMLVPKDAGVGLLLWGQHHGWDKAPAMMAAYEDAWTQVFCAINLHLSRAEMIAHSQLASLHAMPNPAAVGERAH